MLGGLGNMFDLLKNAKNIQAQVSEMQKNLVHQRYDAETGGGAVRVTVDGQGSIVNVKIDPPAAQDVELLEDLVKSAVNAADTRSQDAMKQEMAKLTGGLNLPTLESMLMG